MSEIRGVKSLMEKIRGLKICSEEIRGFKILGFSEENTPGGYSPLKMSAPLGIIHDSLLSQNSSYGSKFWPVKELIHDI